MEVTSPMASKTEFEVPAQYEDLTPAPNVDQKTLNRMALRSCWLQSSFNYETMQSGGWLFAMIPGLEKVHTNKNDLAASMYHNLDFINTHPFLVTFVMGIVLALEQNKVDTQTIRAVRISAASPLGGIGDALFWLTLVPITAGITSNMALDGNIAAPIIFLVIFNIAQFACRFGLMNWSYSVGTSAIDALTANMQAFTRAASILGVFVVGALTAFIIGPIGVWVGNGLGVGLAWMNTHAPFIFAIIIPLLYPFLVPLGLHWPLNALMLMNIQTLGYDFIQGPMGVWNFACFGATAGVLFIAVRDKDKDMRQTALGALAAGLLGGVSEPSLYGIHLRYKLVYKRMLVGCGLGGVVIAVLGWLFPSVTAAGQTVHGVTTTAFAFTSLLTIPVFDQMWVYAVSIAVSFLTSFFLIITFDYRTPEQKAEVLARAAADQKAAAPAVEAKEAAPAATTATATATATKTEAPAAAVAATTVVNAPVAGHVIALDETGDPVFASRALGEGVGIQPTDSEVVAPVSGVLQTVAETGHAFGIKTDDGVEVLVHVGIDTVKMNGEGFAVKVKADERVNAGDPLVSVDFAKVKDAGYSTTTLMTVLNTAALTSVTPKTGIDVKAGDEVIDIQR